MANICSPVIWFWGCFHSFHLPVVLEPQHHRNLLQGGKTAVYLPVSLMDAEVENNLSFAD